MNHKSDIRLIRMYNIWFIRMYNIRFIRAAGKGWTFRP